MTEIVFTLVMLSYALCMKWNYQLVLYSVTDVADPE